jgi:ABC-type glycerol-3-phosphate transport system permease component
MVHLYQYQLYVDACEQLAGYAIASVPTLLVFILTQKMILRGIVLPSYK